MTLASRITALERAAAKADIQPSCATCGGIQAESLPTMTVTVGPGDECPLKSCPGCGFWLDERGIAIGSRHEGRDWPAKLIVLQHLDDREPPRSPVPSDGPAAS